MNIKRAIHGICSTERIIDHSRFCDGSDYKMLLARGMALMTPLPLLLNHSGDPIGKVLQLRRLESQIYCIATVTDAQVWKEVANYRLRGLSIGFISDHHVINIDEEKGLVRVIDRARISEVSIVGTPLNKDCYLAIYAGGMESRVGGQRSLSEHIRIANRARAVLARLNEQYPAKAENSGKQRPKGAQRGGSAPPKLQKVAKDRNLPPDELARVQAWLKSNR